MEVVSVVRCFFAKWRGRGVRGEDAYVVFSSKNISSQNLVGGLWAVLTVTVLFCGGAGSIAQLVL